MKSIADQERRETLANEDGLNKKIRSLD